MAVATRWGIVGRIESQGFRKQKPTGIWQLFSAKPLLLSNYVTT
jgi:hypothetical protein